MAVLVELKAREQRARSLLHASLGGRVVACLEEYSRLSGTPFSDERLGSLRRASQPYELNDLLTALDEAIRAVLERMQTPSRGTRATTVFRWQTLLAELNALAYEIRDELVDRRTDMLQGIAEALDRLRGAESTSLMIERVTTEVCRSCGVDRCVLFRTDGASLVAESIHFAEDKAFEEEWSALVRKHPPVLDPRDREVQALRRRVAIMVDPESTVGMRQAAEAAKTSGYVAAPVVVRGQVVGLLHADRYFSGARVDPVCRDVLATFASGFGYALERNVLIDRTRSQLRRMQEMMAEMESSMEELFHSGVSLRREPRGPSEDPERRHLSHALPPPSRLSSLLTRRELEVMELMARGASNGDIANQLVISEGTVKSHVKHILRKLRAANRAQAVSTYMRIQTATHEAY
jgi:DNA-binding CsgD family transcriptional regulator